jgi:hypothetical protein
MSQIEQRPCDYALPQVNKEGEITSWRCRVNREETKLNENKAQVKCSSVILKNTCAQEWSKAFWKSGLKDPQILLDFNKKN